MSLSAMAVPSMHAGATDARSTDTNWNSYLAPKKRDAAFRRQVSELHRGFCDCGDYRLHFSWPTTPEQDAPAGDGEGSTAGGTDVSGGLEEVGDESILEAAGGDIAGDIVGPR